MNFSRLTKSDISIMLVHAFTHEDGNLIRSVAEQATRQQIPLYIVGGFVRDLLLGYPSLDFDLVVEGDAVKLAQMLASRLGGKVTVHPRFKTAQWFPPPGTALPEFLDFSTARTESYKHQAALPTVKPGTLIDDLHRRDFTLNTLALRLDGDHYGELIDELGGLGDLNAGIIRTLHDKSFEDDPTRLFRMVRYEVRYGFKIAPETKALIPGGLQYISRLSAERVRHELDLILEEEKAAAILKRLANLGILAAVHPALGWNKPTHTRFVEGLAALQGLAHPPSRLVLAWPLWLMTFSTTDLLSIEKKFHFDAGLRDILKDSSILYTNVDSLPGKRPSLCVSVLEKYHLNAVQAVYLGLPAGASRQILKKYLESWRDVKPKTTGHDLKRRGLPPGPEYKHILRKLRTAWLDGEVTSAHEEIALLDKLVKQP